MTDETAAPAASTASPAQSAPVVPPGDVVDGSPVSAPAASPSPVPGVVDEGPATASQPAPLSAEDRLENLESALASLISLQVAHVPGQLSAALEWYEEWQKGGE